MKNEKRQVARLKLEYPKPQPARKVVENLLRQGLDSALLVRGRMTDHDAWYELEIVGSRRAVEHALLAGHSGLKTA